uniref:Uncharacterized protein n=2 Tax=Lygus hesperus TaxID=30085 RepID=A0A0K8SJE5_LYGHE
MPNMARRGRDRGHYKNYNDHDDRVGGGSHNNDGSRRVSFKNQGGGHRNRNNRNRQQGFDTKHIRSLIMSNDDIDMGGHYNQKPNSQGALKQRKGKRTLKFVANCFYRVEVRYGSRYEKDYLLKVLASHINPTPLIPLGCRKNNNDFVFTVIDHATAEKIMNANRAVTLNDGWKMSLHVRPYTPIVEVDEKLTTAIKAALASRFNAATKSLDLTTFQEDPAFLSQELICPLNRSNVMNFVIELISESVPDLVALNLNKNGISGIEHLKALIDKLPHLRILHMAHNSIREVKQFDPLKGLKLEEINLDGNILASQFNSQEDYIREIRKRFPKVMRLDGVDLPKPITFDLEEEDAGNLPKSQLSFMCDAEHGL